MAHPRPDVPDPTSRLRFDRRRFLQLSAAGAAAMALRPAFAGSALAQSEPAAVPLGLADPIGDLAAALDYDVEKLLRWVAEEIRYDPYDGSLRGARGTLDARAGNAMDQALLLGSLLSASLLDWRLAHGPLTDEGSTALLAAATLDADRIREDAWQVLVEDARAAMGVGTTEPDVDPDLAAYHAASAAQAADLVPAAGRQLDATLAALDTALAAAGVVLPAPTAALPASEAADHTWVQVRSGADWIDLDPSSPAALPGEHLAASAEALDALPSDRRHRVEFAVLVESVTAGDLTTASILDHAAYADEIAGLPIAFSNLRPEGLDALGLTLGSILGDGGVTYNALLQVGGATFVGATAFRFGGSGVDLLGEADGSPAPGLAEGEATAQWLEIRTVAPDGSTRVARRTVFDRVGAEARAAGAIDLTTVPPVELVPLETGALPDLPAARTVHAIVVATGATNGRRLLEPPAADNVAILTEVARTYHYLRDGLTAEIGVDRGLRAFPDAPNVVSWTLVPGAPDPDAIDTTLRLDIWHRSLGTAVVADRALSVHPALATGVLAHIAERAALLDGVGQAPDGEAPVVGVGALFEAAAAQGVAIRALRGVLPADLGLPAGPARHIAEALDAGDVVILPAAPVDIAGAPRLGWWRIDPTTGRAVDEMDDGTGSETTEYQVPLTRSFRVAMCMLSMGDTILAVMTLFAKLFTSGNLLPTVLGLAAAGAKTANFFNPGWAKTCRGA